jgi:hypothetical protein
MDRIDAHDDAEDEVAGTTPSGVPDEAHDSSGTDEAFEDAGPHQSDEPPSGFDRWRRDSALGAVGTGVARGLQAVFAPPVDEPVIVAAVPGEPPGEDERIRVVLDPDDPTKSVAIVPERTERPARPERPERPGHPEPPPRPEAR